MKPTDRVGKREREGERGRERESARASEAQQRNRFAEDLFCVPPVAEPATRRPCQETGREFQHQLENRENMLTKIGW